MKKIKILVIILGLLLLWVIPAQADLTDGLIGWWKFDEGSGNTALDSSGNGNDGTLVNGPTWTTGQIEQALQFDGVDDRVNAGSLANLDNLPAVSISIWANARSFGAAGQGVFVGKDNGYGSLGWHFQKMVTGSTVYFIVDYDGATNLVVYAANNTLSAANFNKWIHWVVTWDGSSSASNVHIYKNGVEVSYGTKQNGAGNRQDDSAQNLSIGNGVGTRAFDGALDDVQVYNRVLPTSEVQDLFVAGGGIPADTQAPSVPTELSAVAISSSQINLLWVASTDNTGVMGYTIYRNGTQLTITSDTFYSDTSLSPSTTYSYTVSAYDAAGNQSVQTSSVSATTQAVLPTTYTVKQDGIGDFTTINSCLAAAENPGDTCLISSGTYHETISPTFSGTYVNPITVQAAPSATVKVDGINLDNTSNIWIQRLQLQSISQYGIIWTFDNYYPVGLFANGDYWVQGPVTIVSMMPAWDGVHNGWEVNPMPSYIPVYDIGGYNWDASKAAATPSLPYLAQPGSSILKTYSFVQDPNDTTKCYSGPNTTCLKTAAVLTIVTASPPDNGRTVFRPPYVGTSKPYYSINNLQINLLPFLPSVANAPDLDSMLEKEKRVQMDHIKGADSRTTRPALNLNNYAPSVAVDQLNAILLLTLNNNSISAKMPLLITLVQGGIDRYHMHLNGQNWPGGGGETPGPKLSIDFAAVMLNNQAMMDYMKNDNLLYEDTNGPEAILVTGYNDAVLWDSPVGRPESFYWDFMLHDPGCNQHYGDPYGYIDGGGNTIRIVDGYQPWTVSRVFKGEALVGYLISGLKQVWNDHYFYDYADRWVNIGIQTQPDACAPVVGICQGGTNAGAKCTTQTEIIIKNSDGTFSVSETGTSGGNGGNASPDNSVCTGGGFCNYNDPTTCANNYGITYGPHNFIPGGAYPHGDGTCILDPNLTVGSTAMTFTCQPGKLCGRFPQRQGIYKDYSAGGYGSAFIDNMWAAYRNLFFYGDVSGNGQVSAYDASLAAQYAVGSITLTQSQITKADVSGNSSVTAYDASLIAQKAVGLIEKFPVEG